MSANLQQVAEDVRAFARMFRSVETLALALGEVGNLESYKAELERSIGELGVRLDGLNGEAEIVAARVAEEMEKAKAEAARIRDEANVDANALVARSVAEATERVEVANAKVLEAEESARKQVQYATEAQAMADAARAELGELEKRIEAAKATIQNILGAN